MAESSDNESKFHEEANHVVFELSVINDHLKNQSNTLVMKERKLFDREEQMIDSIETMKELKKMIEHRFMQQQKKEKEIKEKEKALLSKLSHCSEKNDTELQYYYKENRRLKDSFECLKQSNCSLRKQVESITQRNLELQNQLECLQGRVNNYQRLVENHHHKTKDNIKIQESDIEKKQVKHIKKISSCDSTNFDVIISLMHWVTKLHVFLTCYCEKKLTDEVKMISYKFVPSLPHIIDQSHKSNDTTLQLVTLEFTHMVIQVISSHKQYSAMTTSLRRIGEIVINNRIIHNNEQLQLKILSLLILVQTVKQIDILVQVFDNLHTSLKIDMTREFFIMYGGMSILLSHLRTENYLVCGCVLNIVLSLTDESSVLACHFIPVLCTEQSVTLILSILKNAKDIRLLEKLSIILHRLSKLKCYSFFTNKSTLIGTIRNVIETHNDLKNTFLILNLKSVLIHLENNV